jgi:saccharopine dehydrogenase-like NADP-dependent oxidoreductase
VNARNKDEVKTLIQKYEVDLLFNACDPSFNETLFDTAYECGVRYADMALSLSIPHPTDPYHKTNVMMGDYQFAKHEDWEKCGLLALVGIGMDPGAVNVFARFAQKHYFDEIDEISIKDGGNLTAEGYDITFGFSIWTTIDECLNPPFKWEKEKGIYTVEPFSEPELFPFPDGIGEQELVNVEHEEMVMLPRFMGDSAFIGCIEQAFIKAWIACIKQDIHLIFFNERLHCILIHAIHLLRRKSGISDLGGNLLRSFQRSVCQHHQLKPVSPGISLARDYCSGFSDSAGSNH